MENSAKNQEENANSLPNDESFILKSFPRKEPMVFESKMNQLKRIKRKPSKKCSKSELQNLISATNQNRKSKKLAKSSQNSEQNNDLWSDGDIFTAESIYGKRQRNGKIGKPILLFNLVLSLLRDLFMKLKYFSGLKACIMGSETDYILFEILDERL